MYLPEYSTMVNSILHGYLISLRHTTGFKVLADKTVEDWLWTTKSAKVLCYTANIYLKTNKYQKHVEHVIITTKCWTSVYM